MSKKLFANEQVSCLACGGECATACFNDAIVPTPDGYVILDDMCAGCGACQSVCRYSRIELYMGVAHLVESY